MARRILSGPFGDPCPSDSIGKFYQMFAGPANWRVWWDSTAELWHCQKWTGGGILSSRSLDVNQTRFVAEGDHLRFKDCDCWANGVRFDGSQNAKVDVIRLRYRPVQVVGVAPVAAASRIKV